MQKVFFFTLFLWQLHLSAQTSFSLAVLPTLSGEKIVIEQAIPMTNGDTLEISTLRFYLSNLVFYKAGYVVFEGHKKHHLVDLEDETSMILTFDFPQKTDFDSLRFDFGIDSATTISGAMGGDLDPTRGMFWAWQSGYINFKIEGFSQKSPARNGEFQFHLGGYLPPFQTMQTVGFRLESGQNPTDLRLDFDLTAFFEKIDWQKKPNIMSPCAEATQLMDVLAGGFRIVPK